MLKEKIDEEILSAIAPCSMFCSTCTGCSYGDIHHHATELLHLLEGHEEFLNQNLSERYRHKLNEYKVFHKKLNKLATSKCGGCRNKRANGCCIRGCVIPDCVEEHQVLFCAFCQRFPCDKVNEKIYSKEIIKKWLDGNMEIKRDGIISYYEKNKDKPHYIDYVK